MKKQIVKRLQEPSTWAGLTGLGLLFGLDAVKLNAIAQAGVAFTGLLAIVLPEKAGS